MSQANHITGGIVFTGIFAALWDVNIFSDANMLVITAGASLLPDIDHTKGIIGKVFYPVSKWIDKKYGHRTITHSLIFCFAAIGIAKIFLNGDYTLVFSLALFSHLILDMVTVSGVPLFYPFKKNPCVIPANPESRIKSGSARTELIAFLIFVFAGFTCYPLMANGFWLSFNKALGTQKQLISEFKRTDKILYVKYTFRRDFKTHTGSGLCLSAEEAKVVILDTANNEFVIIQPPDISKQFIFSFSPYTSLEEISETKNLTGITADSLNSLSQNRKILSAQIFSSLPLTLSIENKTKKGEQFTFEYINTISVLKMEKDNTNNVIKLQIKKLEEQYEHKSKEQEYDQKNRASLQEEYKLAGDIRRTEIIEELNKSEKVSPSIIQYLNDRDILKARMKETVAEKKVYGTIKFVKESSWPFTP